MGKLLVLLLCCGPLAGCDSSKAGAAGLAGTYQAPAGACTLTLKLDPGLFYTYERQCAAGPIFSNLGSWKPGEQDGKTVVVLHDFKWGAIAGSPEPGAVLVAQVDRPWLGLGQSRLCLDLERSYCFAR